MKSPIGCLYYFFKSNGSFSWVSIAGWHNPIGVNDLHYTEQTDMKLQIKTSANFSHICTDCVLEDREGEKKKKEKKGGKKKSVVILYLR